MKRLTILLIVLLFATLRSAATEIWWGMWNSSMPAAATLECNTGINTFGIRLVAGEQSRLADSQAHGVRFYISDKSAVTRAWIWVSGSQFDWSSGQPDTAVRELSPEELKDMAHDGEPTVASFSTPAPLLGTGRYASAYVGFALEVQPSGKPCQVYSAFGPEGAVANSFYKNWTQQHLRYGLLAMQVLLSGAEIGGQGVAVAPPANEVLLQAGQTLTRQTTFTVDGANIVESLDCQVVLDGVAQATQHLLLPEAASELGAPFTLPLELQVPEEARAYNYEVLVTHVNGQPNESPTPCRGTTLKALSQPPMKRSVMEELTGTWCPNCPRGLVGMRLMEQLFADRFVGIAVHGGSTTEPMRLKDYDNSNYIRNLSSRLGGRPSCAIDRQAECDPFGGYGDYNTFGVDVVVGALLQQPIVADVDVSARWQGDDICIDVATTFRYSASEAPYQLMLAITADSLQGEGEEWLQVNNLVGKTEYDSYLDEFIYGTRLMSLKYNHVPIWAEGVDTGIAASISSPLQADVAQHYVRTVPASDCPLMQSRQWLHAVAMLIDLQTGHVVNVGKASVAGAGSGIATPPSPLSAPSQRYTLDGRPTQGPTPRGIYVQRRADGSVRKVLAP